MQQQAEHELLSGNVVWGDRWLTICEAAEEVGIYIMAHVRPF